MATVARTGLRLATLPMMPFAIFSAAFQAGGNQAPLPVTSCTRKYTDSATFLYFAHRSGARIE